MPPTLIIISEQRLIDAMIHLLHTVLNRCQNYGHRRTSTFSSSPETLSPSTLNMASSTEQVLKRSKTFFSAVQQVVAGEKSGEPAFVQKRKDAEATEKDYQIAVKKLDRQRLALEERIDDTLKLLQRWESERLRALKTGKSNVCERYR